MLYDFMGWTPHRAPLIIFTIKPGLIELHNGFQAVRKQEGKQGDCGKGNQPSNKLIDTRNGPWISMSVKSGNNNKIASANHGEHKLVP